LSSRGEGEWSGGESTGPRAEPQWGSGIKPPEDGDKYKCKFYKNTMKERKRL